jgi:heme-degrading monooxygenase HmoA
MTQVSNDESQAARFRVDKFAVPADALDAFVAQMKHLQHTLRSLPGCENACVLKQVAGPGRFNVLTWVEWKDPASVAHATAVMQKKFADEGFDPKAFTEKLGVQGDLGLYGAV